MEAEDSLFKFPCEFPIKAMGRAGDEFDCLVVEIVRRHSPDIAEGSVTSRLSQGGRYLAVTVTILAESRQQLDAIYMDLTSEPRVLYTL